MSVNDRFASLSRGEIAGLAVLVALTLGGAGLWYARSLPKPVSVAGPPAGASPVVRESVAPSPTASPVVILVDVAGWVKHPGVYEFHEGDRVVDALKAAGGARPDANLAALNLAAPLTDGSQILVSKEGAVAGMPGSSSGATGSVGATGTLININTAAEPELENLPGVGPVLGAAIVAYRTENGPFATIDDLLNVSGIGPSTLEEIRPMATV